MLRKISIFIGIFIVVAFLSFRLTGCCSLIGFGIGWRSDVNKPSHTAIPGWEVETVKPGKKITIFLNDGNSVSGRYIGFEHIPADEYTEKYDEGREKLRDEVLLPAISENITLITESGKEHKCEFQGFDSRHIWVIMGGNTEPEPMSFSLLTKIAFSQGKTLDAETVRILIMQKRLASFSAIAIDSEIGRIHIAMENVKQVQIKVKKYGILKGFLIGAAIDALLIYLFILALHEELSDMEYPLT